jgi:hypothetical protein
LNIFTPPRRMRELNFLDFICKSFAESSKDITVLKRSLKA